MPIFGQLLVAKLAYFTLLNSGVTRPKFTKFLRDVDEASACNAFIPT